MGNISKIVATALTVFFTMQSSFSQQKINPLKIGDQLPEMTIQGIINRTGDQVNLKDLYRDGLLIIDFWATWCAPCIKEMKFLDSLKGKNPGKFNVLMITYQDKRHILDFLSRAEGKELSTANLILATQDTLLSKLFPHRGIPHNIWLDKNGIIRAITSGNAVTSENILQFSQNGIPESIAIKRDIMDFNAAEVFHLGDRVFTYRSIITPHIKGMSGGIVTPSGSLAQRYFQHNQSILRAYWSAYSKFNAYIRYNLMEIHTRDSLRFFEPTGKYKHLLNGTKYKDLADWQQDHTFCYDLTLPKPVADTEFSKYMYSDLERQFNIRSEIENRQISCTIVTRTKGTLPLAATTDREDSAPSIQWMPEYKLKIRNATIGNILDWWFSVTTGAKVSDPYVLNMKDSEGIHFDAILDFSAEITGEKRLVTTELFHQQLQKYGFRFEKEIRSYPILVLYDQN